MTVKKILKQIGVEKKTHQDLHVTRFFSSFVVVSEGKVIKVTDPSLKYCPLAGILYGSIRHAGKNAVNLREVIKGTIEEKISRYGFFTENRELSRKDIAIPYGASEMMMYAMNKNIIDSAVVVCDGAGTVITDSPEVIQGIGSRMNGLFLTSPINGVIKRLREKRCCVVFPETAEINQYEGLRKAAECGYRNIAVTINGYTVEGMDKIKEIEEKYNVSVTSLIVCNTGVTKTKIQEIRKYADIVWSCASEETRKIIGEKAILQLSAAIPVFVLTKKGISLIAGYCSNEKYINSIDLERQYLVSGNHKGIKMSMGNFSAYLGEETLPVRSNKEPVT